MDRRAAEQTDGWMDGQANRDVSVCHRVPCHHWVPCWAWFPSLGAMLGPWLLWLEAEMGWSMHGCCVTGIQSWALPSTHTLFRGTL
jgi:hypothetical protein